MKIIKCGSLEEALQCISNAIGEKMDESKMTQENKPTPHVHAEIISEWVKDTTRVLQCRQGDNEKWMTFDKPHWHADTQYRFKPRWFDMEQEWIAKGKPAVEYYTGVRWIEEEPLWYDSNEYRFKEVSRHAALRAEWEAKGRPTRQVMGGICWLDIEGDDDLFCDALDYRIKPTQHPDADVLRAMAEDSSLMVLINVDQYGWGMFDLSKARLRIKP